MYIGNQDHFFPLIVAKLTWEIIKQAGGEDKIVEHVESGLGHSVSGGELAMVQKFLEGIMK